MVYLIAIWAGRGRGIIMEKDLNFLLGQIVTRLDNNDYDHAEIKGLLKDVTKFQIVCNEKIIALETRAKVWGGIAGVIMGGIISAIGWVLKH